MGGEDRGLPERLRGALAGRYTIGRELGRGGMATVYLARDLKHDRPVALKVLRPELAATVGAERFLREIQVTAHLTHPNILPLPRFGTHGRFPLLRHPVRRTGIASQPPRSRKIIAGRRGRTVPSAQRIQPRSGECAPTGAARS